MPSLTSLKRALTLNFLLVASIPVLLLGLLNINLISKHQLIGVRERNMVQVKNIAEEVDAFLVEVRSDLQNVQQTIAARLILQPNSVDQFLAGVVSNSQFFESIYLLDNKHQVLNLGLLPKLQARRDDYARLDFSGHQLFQALAEIQRPVWSNPFVSLVTGELSVTLGLPMPHGFLLGNIRLSSLDRFLKRYSIYGDVEAAIIDHSGTLIAHNVSGRAMQRINFADHPTVATAMAGDESTQEFLQGAKHYLESAARVKSSGWIVWVGLDMHAVLAPIHDMRNLLICFTLVAIFLASVIALMNARRFMQPLTALGLRAGKIADGYYDFDFEPSGFSEIDTLANQISNMTSAIKLREDSIITNEQRFRNLVNSVEGIVWEMEYPSFRFLFVSQQAETMLGYPLNDWYDDPFFWENHTHVEDAPQAKAYCQLMTEKHTDHDIEYRMISADGQVVWIRDLVTVVVEGNRPVRLLGVMIDVTAQKGLLEELSRSEQNYREIFNAANDAIFVHDAESGKILDVNQSMLKMFNSSYSEVINCEPEAFSLGEPPYSNKEVNLQFQKVREQGSSTFEWRSRKSTGEIFWTEIYLRSAVIGDQPRILAAVRDISERKVAAEKLREANERLMLLIERMPLGCLLWTPEFTVNMWNPAAELIFGYSAEEMIGCSPYGTIVPPEKQPEVARVWDRLIAGDESAHNLNENLTKQGKLVICEWYNTPLRALSGDIIGVISMVQDVSDRKAVEDELTRYRVHLEELVRERTAQLEKAQEELVHKGRLAVLGQLTATVSHEIRNPLGTIANALYMIKDSLNDGKHEHLTRPIQLAERNVERCDGIISDLLDFSRQRKIQKEPLDIDAWLADLLGEISFPDEVRCSSALVSQAIVLADSERLRRVLVNVITNALQALDEVKSADKTIKVQARIVANHCEISVFDNGQGMSEEIMTRIFEPMFSTKNFGVGLGVPIIKNILEGHGGGVTYHSQVGEGTTVVMWLPLGNENPS